MSSSSLFVEKAGAKFRAEIFETENGSGIHFFVNGELIKETIYEDKTLKDSHLIAEKWINGVEVLKG